MKYEIIVKPDMKKYVKFSWDYEGETYYRTHFVNKDKEGHEYVSVPNIINKKGLWLFSGRIKDAVEQIRNGIGDCILKQNFLFCRGDRVVMFLDREYGECIKAKFIEEWKNAVFGYSIEGCFHNSFNGPVKMDKDGNPCESLFGKNAPYIYFETEEEAQAKINEWTKKAKIICKNYEKLESGLATRDELELLTKDTPYVIHNLTYNFDHNKDNIRYALEIVQVVKEGN